jgi:hypothetical protein
MSSRFEIAFEIGAWMQTLDRLNGCLSLLVNPGSPKEQGLSEGSVAACYDHRQAAHRPFQKHLIQRLAVKETLPRGIIEASRQRTVNNSTQARNILLFDRE